MYLAHDAPWYFYRTERKVLIEEIKFVMAHEISHYKLKHIYIGLAVNLVIMFFIIFGGYLLYNFLIKKFGKLWGVGGYNI